MNPLLAVKLRGLDLFDRLMGRSDELVPPRRMNFVGPGDFVKTGDEFLGYFKELGGLQPGEDVLDIGCGIGRMARPLTTYLDREGSYKGFDVAPEGIDWCQRQIASRYPNFSFDLLDLKNAKYNPSGTGLASNLSFPYPDQSFDFVFATSVFTHLVEDDLLRYLQESSRVLRCGGRLFATFFLLNEESRTLIEAGRSQFPFPTAGDVAVLAEDLPEEAIAFDQRWLSARLNEVGLRCRAAPAYGSWCGRKEFTTLQDVVVAIKA